MNRWKASAAHFIICIVIAAAVLLLMLLAWFPPPYFSAQGGKELFYLIISVDVVLGPLITLVVYKHGKKGLKFDLIVIALLQISALGYGIVAISKARPVYMVYSIDRFELINGKDIDPSDMRKATLDEFKSFPLTGPKLIGAKLPDNAQERNEIMFASFSGGADISALPKYYVPYQSLKQEVIEHLKPLSRLTASAKLSNVDLDQVVKDTGLAENELGFLPITTVKDHLAAIVNRQSAEIMDVIPVDPWV
ncbi:MAG: TfpX/TfpZ family type IV pilin accessory protein [Methylococcales bacterium]